MATGWGFQSFARPVVPAAIVCSTMPKRKLTTAEFVAIDKHNALLIAAADTNLDGLMQILPKDRSDNAKGKIRYWKAVRSALRWSTEIARQRVYE